MFTEVFILLYSKIQFVVCNSDKNSLCLYMYVCVCVVFTCMNVCVYVCVCVCAIIDVEELCMHIHINNIYTIHVT